MFELTGVNCIIYSGDVFHVPFSFGWSWMVLTPWKLLAIYFAANNLPWKLIDGSVSTIFPYKKQKEKHEKRLQHKCIPVHFAEFLRTHFFRKKYGGYFWRSARRNQTNPMTSRLSKCYLWMIHFELFWQPVEMGT